jgi:hypothetical protein
MSALHDDTKIVDHCEREHWKRITLESAPPCMRGVEPNEHHSWRVFDLGVWINPYMTCVYSCTLE